MPPNSSFESQSSDFKDNDQDPDVNFYQTQTGKFPTKIIFRPTFKMSKNFESFREFLNSLCFTFSAIYLSETWCQPHETSNSNIQIPGYVSLHQTRKNCRGGGLSIFLLKSLSYKVRHKLAVKSSAVECLYGAWKFLTKFGRVLF